VGNAVRVKAGVFAPDLPDVALAGWAGVISEIDVPTTPVYYKVTWSEATRAAMPPVYREPRESAGVGCDFEWLSEEDLEPDRGGPVTSQQPAQPVARPQHFAEPEDRIRAIFQRGLSEPLPSVTVETLNHYRDYLASRLRFPFPALRLGFRRGEPPLVPVTVLRFAPVGTMDTRMGLLVEVYEDAATDTEFLPLIGLQALPAGPDGERIDDYLYWMENAPGQDQGEEEEEQLSPQSALKQILTGCCLLLGGAGVAGGVIEAVEGARTGAMVGAVFAGLAGFAVGATGGARPMFASPTRAVNLLVGVGMGLLGGTIGAIFGTLIVAFLGTIPGAIAGSVTRRLLKLVGVSSPGELTWVALGGCCGAFVLAWLRNADRVWTGALYGVGAGFLICLLILGVLMIATFRGGPPSD
jgi:hypothetical protein